MSYEYTKEQIATLEAQDSFTFDDVNELAAQWDLPASSIRAKIIRMEGVTYVPKGKVTKSGEPVESKEAIVQAISDIMEFDCSTLVTANKAPLQRLRDRLSA